MFCNFLPFYQKLSNFKQELRKQNEYAIKSTSRLETSHRATGAIPLAKESLPDFCRSLWSPGRLGHLYQLAGIRFSGSNIFLQSLKNSGYLL